MNAFTDTIIETFKVVSCYTCGVRFGITGELYRRVVTDANGSIYCPACGNQTVWSKSEAQKRIEELERKLKWEADNAASQKTARELAEASLIATKGQLTKIRNRVEKGVCPCCNRSFPNLRRHMATKHPKKA